MAKIMTAPSERTLRSDIEKSDFTTGSGIQVYLSVIFSHSYIWLVFITFQTAVIKKAAAASTEDTWWWIKGDGCDVVKGIWESTKGVWSGDVDLADGQLEHLYQQYQKQLHWIEGLGLESRGNPDSIRCDIDTTMESSEFIHSGKLAPNV